MHGFSGLRGNTLIDAWLLGAEVTHLFMHGFSGLRGNTLIDAWLRGTQM